MTGESVRGFVCACVWLCNRWRAEEWRARGLTWPSNGLAASPLLGSCTLRAGIRYVPPYVFFTCLSLSPFLCLRLHCHFFFFSMSLILRLSDFFFLFLISCWSFLTSLLFSTLTLFMCLCPSVCLFLSLLLSFTVT